MTTEVILTGTGSLTPSLAGSAPVPSWKAVTWPCSSMQAVRLPFGRSRPGRARHGSMALAMLLLTWPRFRYPLRMFEVRVARNHSESQVNYMQTGRRTDSARVRTVRNPTCGHPSWSLLQCSATLHAIVACEPSGRL